MALRWFKRNRPPEIWDERIDGPIGDLEAAHRIRDICRAAADSAQQVAGFAGKSDSKKKRRGAERYESAAKAAMMIAMKIADDLLRDAAVRQIIDLCVKADDLTRARILLRAIQAASIREGVLQEHPALQQ
jgi:hypothetical protein